MAIMTPEEKKTLLKIRLADARRAEAAARYYVVWDEAHQDYNVLPRVPDVGEYYTSAGHRQLILPRAGVRTDIVC